jgi:hypothetical protein
MGVDCVAASYYLHESNQKQSRTVPPAWTPAPA